MKTENKDTINIIIPVYNGEQHLSQCIDSIINQTYQDWSLLLVDDGSTDRTGEICDMYAVRDKRITVIHKENEGAAAARNYGMQYAQGDFISFIDCDDWLEPTMYETMVTAMTEDIDVIICGYIEEYVNHDKQMCICQEKRIYDCEDILKLFIQNKIGSYFWSMLFRRDLVQEPILNLRYHEDHATIIKWVSHARKVAILPDLLYHYRQSTKSNPHSATPNSVNYYIALKERHDFIRKNNLLQGWDEERKCYLHGCLKAAKDLARNDCYNTDLRNIISNIRTDIQNYMPVKCKEIGIKYYIRLKLLLYDIDIFVSTLRLSSHLQAFKKLRKKHRFKTS